MPTLVQFAGGEALKLTDDFDTVNDQLHGADAHSFTGLLGSAEVRVTVYRTNVAYIQELGAEPEGPLVAYG